MLDGSAGLAIVRLPVSWPAAVGTNSICAVQDAAAARVEPQVLEAIWKSLEAVRAKLDSVTDPLFVSVMVCAALVTPTPVVANVIDAG